MTIHRHGFRVLLSCLAVACGANAQPDASCPSGWTHDAFAGPTYCREPQALSASVKAELGTGIYGFVQLKQGNCMPCPKGAFSSCPTNCRSEVQTDVSVGIYRTADVAFGEEAHSECARVAADPVAELRAVEGIYKATLTPGHYALVTMDPVDACLRGFAFELLAGDVKHTSIVLDHATY